MKKTLVVGATPNPQRYAYMATTMLREYGHEVYPYGNKSGNIEDLPIHHNFPEETNFDTITLYLNPANQKAYEERILALKPIRVIFNPGTENPEFEMILSQNHIEAIEACTLVLLRTNQY